LSTTHHALLTLLQLSQALHFLEHVFKQVFTSHDIEVAFDLGVFLCKAVDFFLGEVAT
jgi:hypothetical protein